MTKLLYQKKRPEKWSSRFRSGNFDLVDVPPSDQPTMKKVNEAFAKTLSNSFNHSKEAGHHQSDRTN